MDNNGNGSSGWGATRLGLRLIFWSYAGTILALGWLAFAVYSLGPERGEMLVYTVSRQETLMDMQYAAGPILMNAIGMAALMGILNALGAALCLTVPGRSVRRGKLLVAASLVTYCAFALLKSGVIPNLTGENLTIAGAVCFLTSDLCWFVFLKRLSWVFGPEKLVRQTSQLLSNFITGLVFYAVGQGSARVDYPGREWVITVSLLLAGMIFLVVGVNYLVTLWQVGSAMKSRLQSLSQPESLQ